MTKKKLKDGLSTRLFKLIPRLFGFNKEAAESFGDAFSEGHTLSDIHNAYPSTGTEHRVNTELDLFVVERIVPDESLVIVREIATGLEYPLHIDAFDLLFVIKDTPRYDDSH